MAVIAQANDPPWWVYVIFFVALLAIALCARNRDAGFFEQLLRNGKVAHVIGLLGVVFGAGVGYLLVYCPLHDALGDTRIIMIRRGAVALPAVFVFVGSVLLIAGGDSHKFVITRHGQRQTNLQWAVTTLGIALRLALEFGFHHFLNSLGYIARF